MNQSMLAAVEAGGTKFVVALARADGTIVDRHRLPTEHPGITLPALRDWLGAASARHGALAGIGIASFGPIDIDAASDTYGTFTTTPKPGWSGARFHDVLADFGAPIVVDTDVNGAALGEWAAGAGQGCDTLAYTTIGTGIGTGVVQGGAPRGGFSHYESGHIPVARAAHDRDFAGICPFHGDCLEGLASGPAIVARWGDSLDAMDDSGVAIARLADYIGQLAATLVLLHMPDRLIFGGGVMKAPGLIEAIRRQAGERLAGYIRDDRLDPGLERYIVMPGLGDDAGITGAVLLARTAAAQGTP